MSDRERTNRTAAEEDAFFGYGLLNLALFVTALVLIVIGYVFLDQGSVTTAPVLLVLGYAVVLPMAILVRTGEETQ